MYLQRQQVGLAERFEATRLSLDRVRISRKDEIQPPDAPWTRYLRDREIRIFTVGRFKVLECSCGLQRRMLIPCRHILFLNKWRLSLKDIHRRWRLVFRRSGASVQLPTSPEFDNAEVWPHLHLTDEEFDSLPRGVRQTATEEVKGVVLAGKLFVLLVFSC